MEILELKEVPIKNRFSKNSSIYEFQAVASTEHKDIQGETFDIETLQFSSPYPPLYVEHYKGDPPVGNVLASKKIVKNGMPLLVITGGINVKSFPEAVADVKKGKYKGVSIGGVAELKVKGKFYKGLAGEVSLTEHPANPFAVIFRKSDSNGGGFFQISSQSNFSENDAIITEVPKRKLIKSDLGILTFDQIQAWLRNFASAEVAKILVDQLRKSKN